jgi:hypothetical protein
LGAIAPPIARLKMQTDGRKMEILAATEQKWGHSILLLAVDPLAK